VKQCPKCNELNGENRTECYKCGAFIGKVHSYKKICPKCGFIYSANAESCEKCGGRLSVYSEDKSEYDNSGCWLYIVSVLFPFLGIILGIVYIARREDELGKSLIITGVAANITVVLLGLSTAHKFFRNPQFLMS